ncbi:MAG: hypothetical protein BWX86_02963 [Verrucomicrobia bacterium ADurb.Bin122]|nr:MAG: hypothetical protein BWX86_02963 [Verrucomicrobia bacterium ADurb.Bin122]
MDFIAAQHELVAQAKLGDARELVAPEDARDGVVRVAEEKEFGARGDGGFKRRPVDLPAVGGAVERERHGARDAAAVARRRHERRIDGSQAEHFVARLGKGLRGDVEADDETRQPDQPGRIDLPAVAACAIIHDGLGRGGDGARVAENPVCGALLDRLDDGGCGDEIHVGHPERQDVAAGVLLPFLRVGADARGRRVEIKVGHEGADGRREFFGAPGVGRPVGSVARRCEN